MVCYLIKVLFPKLFCQLINALLHNADGAAITRTDDRACWSPHSTPSQRPRRSAFPTG